METTTVTRLPNSVDELWTLVSDRRAALKTGARFAEPSGARFTVRKVLDNGAVSVLFDGGWPLTLAASETSKWTAIDTEFAVAA